ncbi:MAG: hypothetical protein QOE35_1656 [Actinomycetota bacterium]
MVDGVRIVGVAVGQAVGPTSRRATTSPLRFAFGVFRYLSTHRRQIDVVHVGAFQYFALFAARIALAGSGTVVGMDWLEVWSTRRWRDYAGPVVGVVGYAVQQLALRCSPTIFTFSDCHARRIPKGPARRIVRLDGIAPIAPAAAPSPPASPPFVIAVGRLVAHKHVDAIPAAVAVARATIPDLRLLIVGAGPEHDEVVRAADRAGVAEVVEVIAAVDDDELWAQLGSALCLVLASDREGYGLVVAEAAALGTPSIVLADDHNAASEQVVAGESGAVVSGLGSDAIASAIVAVAAEPSMRASTLARFRQGWPAIAASSAADHVRAAYGRRRG